MSPSTFEVFVHPLGKKSITFEATAVDLPTTGGNMGFLPGHAPLFVPLAPGELIIYTTQNTQERLFVTTGIVHVTSTSCDITVIYAGKKEELPLDDIRKELEKIESRFEGLDPENTELVSFLEEQKKIYTKSLASEKPAEGAHA